MRPLDRPQPVEDLVERVAEVVGASVSALDRNGSVLARSCLSPCTSRDEVHVDFALAGQEGELVVTQPGETLPRRVIEHVVDLVTNQIAAVASLSNQHELKNRLIWRLLHGDTHDGEDVIREAQILGMDLQRPRAVMLIDASGYILAGTRGDAPVPQHWQRAETVIHSIVSFFSLPSDAICAYIGEGEIAVLKASSSTDLNPWVSRRPEDTPASWSNLTALKRAGEELLQRLKRDAASHASIGIGRYHPGVRGLSRSYEDARTALAIGRTYAGGGQLYCLDQLGMAALVGINDDGTRRGLARHLIGPLEHEPDLLRTLDVFFAENCSVVATAARLYVHRNTLNYRLDKIESLTGLDPKRFDGAMMLRFALLLCQLDNEALCNCPTEPVVEAGISDNRPMMPIATPA